MANDTRTTRLELMWAESKNLHDGGIELEIAGTTEGGKSHRVVFRMGPVSLGYIADELHAAVRRYQETLDAVKKQLNGSA